MQKAQVPIANAERGTLTEANFAQNKIKSDRSFSEEGQKVYSGEKWGQTTIPVLTDYKVSKKYRL